MREALDARGSVVGAGTARCRGGETLPGWRFVVSARARVVTPHGRRRRRRGGTVTDLAPGSWRRPGCEACPSSTCDDRARHGRRGGGWQDRHQHGRGQESLVGAFYRPLGASSAISTCSRRCRSATFVAGMVEVIKLHRRSPHPFLIELVEEDPVRQGWADIPSNLDRTGCCRRPAWCRRPAGGGLREILNYGHTLGHAIEQHAGYTMRHGDAVAIGMVSRRTRPSLGLIDSAFLRGIATSSALSACPRRMPSAPSTRCWSPWDAIRRRGGWTLRFVVLEDLAQPTRLVVRPGTPAVGLRLAWHHGLNCLVGGRRSRFKSGRRLRHQR